MNHKLAPKGIPHRVSRSGKRSNQLVRVLSGAGRIKLETADDHFACLVEPIFSAIEMSFERHKIFSVRLIGDVAEIGAQQTVNDETMIAQDLTQVGDR
ncbi:hypothetical protein SPAN111604_14000 [Sphingomonas antarctica]